ncbi:MAG: right-handed parallel beta-helix repeat-containing protein [Rikenellaceae bacterium]
MKHLKNLFAIFMLCLCTLNANANDGYITVNSIEALQKEIKKDGVKVRLEPNTYTIDSKKLVSSAKYDQYKNGKLLDSKFEICILLHFSGNNNTVDMSGSTINVDTKLLGQYGYIEFAEALISGNDNYIKGLKLVDYGNHVPGRGSNSVYLMGDRNTLIDADIFAEGSSPYGYGHLLGKGGGSMVKLRKHCVLLIAGIDCKVLDSRFLSHAYGHGIYLQGAVNTLIQGCVVEGQMRSTDEMMAETSGLAFDANFKTLYHPGYMVAGEMKALSEDAYRIYASGVNGRKTVGLNVVNCKAIKMRTGFDVSLGSANGDLNIINCEAIECQFGFSLDSGAVVEGGKCDAKYGPVLTFPYTKAQGSKVEIEITDSQSDYSPIRAAEINGSKHDISLSIAKGAKCDLPIVFGESFRGDVAMFRTPDVDINKVTGAKGVKLSNTTGLKTILNSRASACEVSTNGEVEDLGSENKIINK